MTMNPPSQSPVSFPNFHPTPGRPAYYDEQRHAWQVFRYEQVQRVLSDYTTFTSNRRGLDPGGGVKRAGLNDLDPPHHRELRNLVTQAFTPRIVATFEPQIVRRTHDLLDAVIEQGEMDIIGDFAAPLSLTVISEVIGVPASDHHQLRQLSIACTPIVTPAAVQAHSAMGDYFTALVEQRRQQPGHDLISTLFETQIAGQHLTSFEIVSLCRTLLISGNETTKNWIGNAMACFDQHPDALAEVQAEPDLLPTALEEVLRYLPPVPTYPRVAAVDTIIDEQEVKAGQWVIAHMDAANREETQFPHPDAFDIRRNPNRHLTFGYGIHFCLGAPLARLEAQIALGTLLARCPELRIDEAGAELISGSITYGYKRLPVHFAN